MKSIIRWIRGTRLLILAAASLLGQAQITLVPQAGHPLGIDFVAFSGDGRLALTAGALDVLLWDVASGRELRNLRGLGSGIDAAAFSPDGNYVLTGGRDGVVTVWQVRGPGKLSFQAGLSEIEAISVSPNGKEILTGSTDGKVGLWRVRDGSAIHPFSEHIGRVGAVAFSRDGTRIVTENADKTARVWDTSTGQELRTIYDPLGEMSRGVAFTPDSLFLLTHSSDYAVRVWRLKDGSLLRKFSASTPSDGAPIFSRDGAFIITDANAELQIRRSITGMLVGVLRVRKGHPWDLSSVSFSSNGRFALVSSDADRAAMLFDMSNGKEIRTFEGQASAIKSLAVSTGVVPIKPTSCLFPDRDPTALLATGTWDGTADIWDFESGRKVQTFKPNEGYSDADYSLVSTVGFSSDGAMMMAGTRDLGQIKLWNLRSGQIVQHFPAVVTLKAAISPDNRSIVAVSSVNYPSVWDIESGDRQLTLKGHTGEVYSAEFSCDGRQILTGGWDGTARIWDAKSGELLKVLQVAAYDEGATEPNEASRRINAAAFLSIGEGYVTAGYAPLEVWDSKGTNLRIVRGLGIIDSMSVSPDGKLLAIGGVDGASLWSTTSWRKVASFVGHTSRISSILFTPDGRFVLTGSDDGSVKLWDPRNGNNLATLITFKGGGWAVTDPQGRFDTNDLDGGAPLIWVADSEPTQPLPLEIFMREYYTPGLLTRIVNGERLPDLHSIDTVQNRVQPNVKVVSVTVSKMKPGRVDVVVHAQSHLDAAKNQRSGLRDLRLFRDGQMVGSGYVDVPEACAGAGTKPGRFAGGYIEGGLKDCNFVFRDVMIKSWAKKVTFTAYAFNLEHIKSATAGLDYVPGAKLGATTRKPHAYLLQIGVNHYEASNCELRFSVNDAETLSADLSQRLRQRYLVVPAKLESAIGDDYSVAGKQRIRAELAAIAMKATPDDVFFLTFSGHGYSAPGGQFYILPSDIRGSCHRADEKLLQTAISADELAEWLRPIDAGEMTMILDACDSAESVRAGDFKPGPMGSRGLGQVAYDKRMRILAASQSDAVAHEYDFLKHGLLTYVLTQDGLEQGLADWKPVDKKITVGEWLSYAANAVPTFVPIGKSSTSRAALDRFGQTSAASSFQIPALFDFSKTDVLQLQ